MSIDRSRIRVKAMLVAPNAEKTAHAVSLNAPSAENPDGFHRLIGGGVEIGETHGDAIRREVREELSATIHELRYLGVLENIFQFDGQLGHEIVFVYTGRLDPQPAESGATLTESNGSVVPVVWRPLVESGSELPLYPAGAMPLVGDL
ncbi:MAG: NUDIX domain-containing protein [Microbacterium sp.]|nr:NUDIX domain-containing protein [Microbacterium sp.]